MKSYILHPLRVMLAVRERGGSIEQQAAAVLHDVVEDCDVGDDFLAARFPAVVCDLVDALTKQDGEDYPTFIRQVCSVPGARLIKEADIADNYSRLHLLRDESTKERLAEKYERALALLRNSPTRPGRHAVADALERDD